MTAKLHPHIKHFIRSVVLAEMSAVGPSKSYLWKEELFKKVQEAILEKLETIQTKEDMSLIIDNKIVELKQEIDKTLTMIGNTLKQVPLEIIKRAAR